MGQEANLHYQLSGQGPTLLFVHGLGGCLHDFDQQISYFEKCYQVLAVDLRGFGQSDKPHDEGYSNAVWANDLSLLLTRLNIASVVIIGHSMGGRVATYFAAHYPQQARALVTLNMSPWNGNRKRADNCDQLAASVIKHGMRSAAHVLSVAPEGVVMPAVLQRIKQQLLNNEPVAFALGLRAVANDLRDELADQFIKKIICPALLVRGSYDLTPLSASQHVCDVMPHAHLKTLEKVWHYSMLEQAENTNAVIEEFLKTFVNI